MAGVLVTSIVSGQLISRLGRYRVLPDRGTAMMAVAMFLLVAARKPDTSTWVAAAFAAILGLGLGMVMQVLVLAVQNSVDPSMMGVATSGSTLFRQIGGSIGVALFGDDLREPRARRARAAAARRSHIPKTINPAGDPAAAARRHTRRSPTRSRPRCTRCSSIAAAISLLAFALTWLLREVPLRTQPAGAEASAVEPQRSARSRVRVAASA